MRTVTGSGVHVSRVASCGLQPQPGDFRIRLHYHRTPGFQVDLLSPNTRRATCRCGSMPPDQQLRELPCARLRAPSVPLHSGALLYRRTIAMPLAARYRVNVPRWKEKETAWRVGEPKPTID